MEENRKNIRFYESHIPESFKNPVICFAGKEIPSRTDNISAIGMKIDSEDRRFSEISKGSMFYVKFGDTDPLIKCCCVYSEQEKGNYSLGALIMNPFDHNRIASILDKIEDGEQTPADK